METNDETNKTNKHNMVKSPNLLEAGLPIGFYKHDKGVELWSTQKQL